MIKIEKIEIENFQSHENTQITLKDGLNVIIGASDHGKSAIVRAIKWVLYNEPRGTEYIRQGTKCAKVTLEISNGYTITRERSSGKNRYILKDSEGNATVFEGFGNEVPHEVVKAHGIPKVILDADKKSCINIGGQLEGPFLLSESGALRAKAIGRMTGLHILDKSIKDSAIDLRRENQTKERLDNELENIDEKLLEFKDLDTLKEKLDQSKNIITELEISIDRIEKLEHKRLKLEDIENRCLKANEMLSKLDKINEGEMVLKTIELNLLKLNSLVSVQKRFLEVKKGIENIDIILNKTDNVNRGIELVNTTNQKTLRYEKAKRYQTALSNIQKEVVDKEEILNKTDNVNRGIELVNTTNQKTLRYEKIKKHQIILSNIQKEIDDGREILEKTGNVNIGIELGETIKQKALRYEKIKKHQTILNNIQKDTFNGEITLKETKDIYDVEKIINKVFENNLNIDKLKLYQNKYNLCKKDILNVEKQVKACDNVNETKSIIKKIDEKMKLEKKLIDLNEIYTKNSKRIKDGSNYIDEEKNKVEKHLNEYIKVLKNRGKCPLCDSLIGQDMINNIIAHYKEENK
ncbi:AAA family ATPase [Herbivorax sp. ANBcel31]|uniref:AAA family ATPase n=1 Tax=Herbivorax sp. ANBcel31 TaxID=3069754 RepID=UPI0027B531BA|nr:AAA family ATPase [Herbivorax sp. ANBcel31]MDQ2085250.1 AAA family ATPase [Herbivorax sp. ANBcel31]